MSEIIERVAKAIYAKWEDRPNYAKLQMNGILAEELACAAIEAMREPTYAMKFQSGISEAMPNVSGRIWQKMIDAALSGAPQPEGGK